LLPRGVGPASEITRFDGSLPTTNARDAGDIHLFIFEVIDERAAGCVVTDWANGKDARAESGNVIHGIRSPAGDEFGFAMISTRSSSRLKSAVNEFPPDIDT
jgi:hypothetical protein